MLDFLFDTAGRAAFFKFAYTMNFRSAFGMILLAKATLLVTFLLGNVMFPDIQPT